MEFKIDHLDPMGQGVSKADSITFIKKTLPGEKVIATVTAKKKQVSFARLLEVLEPSPERMTPRCPHFNLCNGCDYLHTSYEREIEYKKNSLSRHLLKFPPISINVHPAPSREYYRNRIQLHYDKKRKILGHFDQNFKIVETPNCKLPLPHITVKLNEIYQNKNHLAVFSPSSRYPDQGHIELYSPENIKTNEVSIAINQNYAHGGFTQVNTQMNQKMRAFLTEKLTNLLHSKTYVLDLFGGNGNLTQKLTHQTIVIDQYPSSSVPETKGHQAFISMDLYQKNALNILAKELETRGFSPAWIIFDPPRSGLKNLEAFISRFNPSGFVYIACDPTSFARDTFFALKTYNLLSVDLFDFFPGTYHYESIGIFAKNNISV